MAWGLSREGRPGLLAGDPNDGSSRMWSPCVSLSSLRSTLRMRGSGQSTEGRLRCERAAEPGCPRCLQSRSARTAGGARHRLCAGRRRPGAGLHGDRSHMDLEQDSAAAPQNKTPSATQILYLCDSSLRSPLYRTRALSLLA